MVFRIEPHVRLHEWVAEERGLFAQAGLDYLFETDGFAAGSARNVTGGAAAVAPSVVRSGAFEDMEAGRTSNVSCACHWAVNAASTDRVGRMYGKAYSVCPSGVFVGPSAALQEPADLAGVEVGVGYHSGSHYSALQALEQFVPPEQIALNFVGRPFDRARLLLDGQIRAVNVWGASAYLLEQLGFRKLVDTTFIMAFLVSPDADDHDVERYFGALLLAQQEIDLAPQRYAHYWDREMPEDLVAMVDVRRFGPGERIVAQPYTREMFERTQGWMRGWDLLGAGPGQAEYETAVLT